jgi:hypothetical protein
VDLRSEDDVAAEDDGAGAGDDPLENRVVRTFSTHSRKIAVRRS